MRSNSALASRPAISYRLFRFRFSVKRTLASGIIAGALFTAGCQLSPPASTGNGALSIPTEGNVRLVATQLENTPTSQHSKWSVVGERNWVEAKAAAGVLSLAKTYPINSPTERGGCNIWEADITAQAKGDTAVWQTRLHGSNGKTVTEEGTIPLAGKKLTDVFQVRQEGAVNGLPVDMVLARIGDKEIHLQISDK